MSEEGAGRTAIRIWGELSAKERGALQDFWKVYDGYFEEIWEETRAALADDPEFGDVVASETWAEQRQTTRVLLGRAILDEDWEPYLSTLREQGAAYARAGLGFGAWFRMLAELRRPVIKLIFETLDGDPERLRAALTATNRFHDMAMSAIADAYLLTKEEIIGRQQEAIGELSTPVLQISDELLLLPIIGILDSHRARQMTDQLLHQIHARHARVAVLDITGVPSVDSMVANHLVQAVQAARLLGAHAVVTGLSADVAQTLVRIGVDLSGLATASDLQTGIERARARLGLKPITDEEG